MDKLKGLIKNLSSLEYEDKGNIEDIFDVDTFLKAIAVNAVIGNYDSYNGSTCHNYYLLEEDGIFKYIPWDFNMAFGGHWSDRGVSYNVDINMPLYSIEERYRPLIFKLLSVEEYMDKYLGYVEKLIKYFNNYEKIIDNLSNIISNSIKNDPSTFYTFEEFEENISSLDLFSDREYNNLI
jgi:hypothetical protein